MQNQPNAALQTSDLISLSMADDLGMWFSVIAVILREGELFPASQTKPA
jgi:hypothetical protein